MSFDDIRTIIQRAHDQHFATQCTLVDHRLAARQKTHAATKAIQDGHDRHLAGFNTDTASAARQAAHKQRMADKSALRADPTLCAVAPERAQRQGHRTLPDGLSAIVGLRQRR